MSWRGRIAMWWLRLESRGLTWLVLVLLACDLALVAWLLLR